MAWWDMSCLSLLNLVFELQFLDVFMEWEDPIEFDIFLIFEYFVCFCTSTHVHEGEVGFEAHQLSRLLCPVPKSSWNRHNKCEPNNIATRIRCNAPQQTCTYALEEPATPFLSHSSIMKTWGSWSHQHKQGATPQKATLTVFTTRKTPNMKA